METNTKETVWKVYDFLRDTCSNIELQGVPYADIWRFYGNAVPDEIEVRVWDTNIDHSLLEKIREQIPSAFDNSGKILEATLRDLILSNSFDLDGENAVYFKENFARLCGYNYTPLQNCSECVWDDIWYYDIPAKLEKKGEKKK